MKATGLIFVALCLAATTADELHRKKSVPISRLAEGDQVPNVMESSMPYWHNKAQSYLKAKIASEPNTNKAKNIIFFIGDGMGISTVAATRMYMGKEANSLSFEQFPHYGLSKPYCVDAQVADR